MILDQRIPIERRTEKKLAAEVTAEIATEKPGGAVRRSSSIRELRHLILHKIPDKLLFKKSNSSTLSFTPPLPPPPTYSSINDNNYSQSAIREQIHQLPSSTDINVSMNKGKCTNPLPSPQSTTNTPPKDTQTTPSTMSMGRINWTPELSPISFQPTLSIDITPLSPPQSPPPSRSHPLPDFRRKLSFRSNHSTSDLPDGPRRPSTSSKYCPSSRHGGGHERRRSKYLNDPTVLSMLDRKFEEALEMGFTSPPPTPLRTPSPQYDKQHPSLDGTTIREEPEEEEEGDIFSRPMPNLALPTLKELDDGPLEKDGEMMTLRLTLTPATALTEVDETLPLEVTGGITKKMGGLGRILGRTRSRKVRV